MWAKTIPNMYGRVTTSKSGPATCDFARRIMRDIKTGKVIDGCVLHSELDDNLHRHIQPSLHDRVKQISKDAAQWFLQLDPDVSELYSPPRIVQEAGFMSYGGRTLKPRWSLDLAVDDPESGQP